MTTVTLLAAGTTAVTSSDFKVAAGQPARVAMTATSTNARMTVHSVVVGVESLYAMLTQSDPGITISAPGTYRVKRPVLTVASGVEVSTLVENNLEAEVGALTGVAVGIFKPDGSPLTYGPSTWAAMPTAASAPGAVIRCSDLGNSPAGTMLISDGAYWRPVGGQAHIVERAGSPFYPLAQNTGATGFNFTLPFAGVIPANFLIPGESQIEVEVWVKKTGGNGTATLNVYLGLNNSNTTDYRIIQGTFASADGSELGLRPLVSVGNALRLSSTTFLSVGSVSSQTNPGTDSAGGMFNSATPTHLTINVGAANAADTFRLCAYRVTVKQ